mmetsp:Transcript_23824/g.39386  ORF Transcript_23824/g.39386 Transcript_23824/m.39386 type:complete len:97 (-) Transcript_23824:23-313(-)
MNSVDWPASTGSTTSETAKRSPSKGLGAIGGDARWGAGVAFAAATAPNPPPPPEGLGLTGRLRTLFASATVCPDRGHKNRDGRGGAVTMRIASTPQ